MAFGFGSKLDYSNWIKPQQKNPIGNGVDLIEGVRRHTELLYLHTHTPLYYDFYEVFVQYLFKNEKKCKRASRLASALLTKNVIPKPIHSHNDYWRELPLFDALARGATSIEADVWYEMNKASKFVLAVGHNRSYLDRDNSTLYNLYTGPLLLLLNPEFKGDKYGPGLNTRGIFFNEPNRTLYFYVDFKSFEAEKSYELLLGYLEPLAAYDLLSCYDTEHQRFIQKQITVIATGNYPKFLNNINGGSRPGSHTRNVFADFTYMPDLKQYNDIDQFSKDFESVLAPIAQTGAALTASVSFKKFVNNFQEFTEPKANQYLLRYVEICHKHNLKVRIWDTPEWPLSNATYVWQKLLNYYKADILSVDNLDAACGLQELHHFHTTSYNEGPAQLPSYENDDNQIVVNDLFK